VLLIIAIVGTTVAPWQLFFQQSNVIDKRITPRWINYERLDTWIGAVVVVIGAAALICVSAFAFGGTPAAGQFNDAGTTASGLEHYLGSPAGGLLAVVLLNASLISAGALTLSTSYAVGDVFGTHTSLHRSFRDAKMFYGIFAGMIAAAAGIVLIPGAPLGVITESVQAPAGVLLPSASVFLLLLCNDREVLGPWRNPPWLNAVASVIVAILVLLSLILMATHRVSQDRRDRGRADRRRAARHRAPRVRDRHAPLETRRRGHNSDRHRTEDSEAAMDDAAIGAPRATAMVNGAQSRDAHASRLPRRRGDPAVRQGRPTRRRIAPRTLMRMAVTRTAPTARLSLARSMRSRHCPGSFRAIDK
jgi:hypothetical protein